MIVGSFPLSRPALSECPDLPDPRPPLRVMSSGDQYRLLRRLRAEWPETANLLGELIHHIAQALAFGGGNPFQAQPLRLDAELREHLAQQLRTAQRFVVSFLIVAIPGMAAADQHAVGAVAE